MDDTVFFPNYTNEQFKFDDRGYVHVSNSV